MDRDASLLAILDTVCEGRAKEGRAKRAVTMAARPNERAVLLKTVRRPGEDEPAKILSVRRLSCDERELTCRSHYPTNMLRGDFQTRLRGGLSDPEVRPFASLFCFILQDGPSGTGRNFRRKYLSRQRAAHPDGSSVRGVDVRSEATESRRY